MENWKPNRIIAAGLGLLIAPLAMLYLKRPWLGLLYLLVILGLVIGDILGWLSTSFTGVALLVVMPMGMVHALWLSHSQIAIRPWYSRWYGLIVVWLLFVLPILVARTFFYEPYRIPASSMAPMIQQGDYILVAKWGCGHYRLFSKTVYQTERSTGCQVQRGDVIVFQYPPNPSDVYIKRVVGLPGDEISYRNQNLQVNGDKLVLTTQSEHEQFTIMTEDNGEKSYQIQLSSNLMARYDGNWAVPSGQYFVLGDNRDVSADSRLWGTVAEDHLIGKLSHVFQQK